MKKKIRMVIGAAVVAIGVVVSTQGPNLVAEKAPVQHELMAQMPVKWGDGGSGGN